MRIPKSIWEFGVSKRTELSSKRRTEEGGGGGENRKVKK